MTILEEKKIVIKLPTLRWSSLLSIRFLIVSFALLCAVGAAYWYRNIRPYLWIPSARVETFSTALNSDVAGRIAEMGAQEGDFVRRGQILYVLDRDVVLAKQSQLKNALESLAAQVEIEKGRIGKAMEEYLVATNEQGIGIEASEQVKKHLALMEEAQQKSESALSKLSSTKMELDLLNLQVKKMSLAAPFDGVVLKRFQNPAAVVAFGDPIYLLSDPDRLWIDAEIPENKVGDIKIGTPAKVRINAYPQKEWEGKISFIGPAASAGGTVPVKIALDKPEPSLKPGLSARVGLKVH